LFELGEVGETLHSNKPLPTPKQDNKGDNRIHGLEPRTTDLSLSFLFLSRPGLSKKKIKKFLGIITFIKILV